MKTASFETSSSIDCLLHFSLQWLHLINQEQSDLTGESRATLNVTHPPWTLVQCSPYRALTVSQVQWIATGWHPPNFLPLLCRPLLCRAGESKWFTYFTMVVCEACSLCSLAHCVLISKLNFTAIWIIARTNDYPIFFFFFCLFLFVFVAEKTLLVATLIQCLGLVHRCLYGSSNSSHRLL